MEKGGEEEEEQPVAPWDMHRLLATINVAKVNKKGQRPEMEWKKKREKKKRRDTIYPPPNRGLGGVKRGGG